MHDPQIYQIQFSVTFMSNFAKNSRWSKNSQHNYINLNHNENKLRFLHFYFLLLPPLLQKRGRDERGFFTVIVVLEMSLPLLTVTSWEWLWESWHFHANIINGINQVPNKWVKVTWHSKSFYFSETTILGLSNNTKIFSIGRTVWPQYTRVTVGQTEEIGIA